MFRVFIKGLECYAYHGVPAEERVIGHRYVVDLELLVEGRPGSDELDDTVDYGAVGGFVRALVEGSQYQTVERLAFRVCSDVLESFNQVHEVRVRVAKRLPPAPFIAETAGVEMTLTR